MNAVFYMPQAGFWQSYVNVPIEPAPWVIASELKNMDQPDQSQIVRLKEDPSGKPIDLGG